MALNFGLQSFDVLSFSFSKSGFYLFDGSTMEVGAFVANKLLRLGLNLACLLLLIHSYSVISKKQGLILLVSMILLCGFHLGISIYGADFWVSVHKVLNPVLYSPLLVIVFLGARVTKHSN